MPYLPVETGAAELATFGDVALERRLHAHLDGIKRVDRALRRRASGRARDDVRNGENRCDAPEQTGGGRRRESRSLDEAPAAAAAEAPDAAPRAAHARVAQHREARRVLLRGHREAKAKTAC
jgi:hypothetical protein